MREAFFGVTLARMKGITSVAPMAILIIQAWI